MNANKKRQQAHTHRVRREELVREKELFAGLYKPSKTDDLIAHLMKGGKLSASTME